MAEQHYKETKAAKQAQAVGEHDSGYRFDLGLCRRTFDEYDKDMSGYLDIRELTNLAEVLYRKATILILSLNPMMIPNRSDASIVWSASHQHYHA